MKKIVAVIVFTVFFILYTCMMANAQTGRPPLFIRHILTEYHVNKEKITLDYKLIVENPGETSISNIMLTLVPLFITGSEDVVLSIGDLPVHGRSEISVHLSTSLVLPEKEIIHQPLLWIVRYRDEAGIEHDAPVESHLDLFLSDGGAQ